MSFSARLAAMLALLVACTAIVGLAAVVTVNDLHRQLRATDERYEELRGLYELGHRAAVARLLLEDSTPDEPGARRQLLLALREAERLLRHEADAPGTAHSRLLGALENIRSSLQASLIADPSSQQAHALNSCLSQVASLASEANRDIVEQRQVSTSRVAAAQWTLAVLLAATLVLALALGWAQHRSIARPLRGLHRGVEGIAAGRLDDAIAETGPREFRDLIRQFNRMRQTIAALEDSLTRQVEIKSRQLIRSERLAGLGYLAAGLAHEINTPLGVIGGYAETMLRRLDVQEHGGANSDSANSPNDLTEALRIISEEVFRCQDITAGLLQMTRHGEERAETVDLGALVERVAHMLRRLPLAKDRAIVVEDSCTGPLLTRGVRSQLTQVLLNLITNALEAVEPGRGMVSISVSSQAGSALLRIADNGCGMSGDTIEHVFDPLFTDKPRRGLTGFGLGLSVSHAIVERHGGRIDVSSDGPERGSTFTIELPAISSVTQLAKAN